MKQQRLAETLLFSFHLSARCRGLSLPLGGSAIKPLDFRND
jgi:hypothetical protein